MLKMRGGRPTHKGSVLQALHSAQLSVTAGQDEAFIVEKFHNYLCPTTCQSERK